jgi:hypothetical protein
VNPVRTSVAVALASGVAVASLALPGSANASTATASTPKTTNRAAAAAGYLARQLKGVHHDHYVDVFGKSTFPDDGETADAILSMDAAGVARLASTRATAWLEKDASNYLTGGGFTKNGTYPGSAAKLLLVATVEHVNPTKFGKVDVLGDLLADEGAGTGAAPGQFQNSDDPGSDSSSNLIQSLAVLALAVSPKSPNGPDSAAIDFLAGQQCANGGYELAIRADTATDCTADDEDIDTTAYAVQALTATNKHAAASAAVAWLLKQRNPDEGWGETPKANSDANSTALAVEALIATHRRPLEGVTWLRNHQQGCRATTARGAVRFQGAKYVAATALRATSQAGVALAYKSLSEVDIDGSHLATPVLKC